MNSEIVLQTPTWYILLCLALGIGFAVLFYLKASIFSRNQKLLLGFLRGALGFTVSYLLLNPLIKTVSSIVIKPKVVILADNSKSMTAAKGWDDAVAGLEALIKNLTDKGYEIEKLDLNGKNIEFFDSKQLTAKKTNLSAALQYVKNNMEGQNLSDLILFSDGIINDGLSPTFTKFPFNVHTIGFGDTTIKKDAFISGIQANKLAYLGNDFSIGVDIGSFLLAGKSTDLLIKNDAGEILTRKKIEYGSEATFESVYFQIPANRVGKQRYIAELQGISEEFTLKNNQREFIVDVVNGREKILLLAYAPHPDIKAIKSIVEKNDLFELNVKIVQDTPPQEILKEEFDLLILHQLPDIEGVHSSFLPNLLSRQKAVFFIYGTKTNLSYLNGMQNIMGVNAQANRTDRVTAKFNPGFDLFSYSENNADLIANLPPLIVPFGNYSPTPGSKVILDQYVSGINTGRPLMAINLDGTRKMGIFLGEGLWHWRMEEFAQIQAHEFLDELFIKTFQLLSIVDDKGKLRVYPVADEFDIDQPIHFSAEAYNEIFERIYNQNIQLIISSGGQADRKFDFTITEEASRFSISNLPAGVYNYKATTNVLGKEETASGQFVVRDTDLEMQNTTADFNLLRTLAHENNGDFVSSENIIELRNSLEKKGLLDKIIAQEELQDIINRRWLFGLILLLASLEWIIRKYLGSY